MSGPHPYEVGTRVYHAGQRWHRPFMGGTASVIVCEGPFADSSYEYKVKAGRDFTRQTGEDNPEVEEAWWSSLATRRADD